MNIRQLKTRLEELNYELTFPTWFDASGLALWKECPHKFFWNVIARQAPKGTNTHLHAGKVYAIAHDIARRHIYRGGSIEEATAMGLKALIKAYGEYEPPTTPASAAAKTWDRVAAGFIQYYERFNPFEDRCIPISLEDDKVGAEYSFSIPFPGDLRHPDTGEPLLYSGRFDMLCHLCSDPWPGHYTDAILASPIYGFDDKTTWQMGPTWAQQWVLRSQFLGYTWSQRALGIDVRGFVVRGTAIQKQGIKFEEVILQHPKWRIARWLEATYLTIAEILNAWEAGFFKQVYDSACGSYGGCTYRKLCSVPDPLPIAVNEFETKHWNPVEDDE